MPTVAELLASPNYDKIVSALTSARDAVNSPFPPTRDNLGQSMIGAIPFALNLMRPGAAPAAAPETITGAAVKLGDRIFTGPHHVAALEEAEKALGPDVGLDWVNAKHAGADPDGFITSTGRFVSRDEAAKIAQANGTTPTGPGGALRAEDARQNVIKGLTQ